MWKKKCKDWLLFVFVLLLCFSSTLAKKKLDEDKDEPAEEKPVEEAPCEGHCFALGETKTLYSEDKNILVFQVIPPPDQALKALDRPLTCRTKIKYNGCSYPLLDWSVSRGGSILSVPTGGEDKDKKDEPKQKQFQFDGSDLYESKLKLESSCPVQGESLNGTNGDFNYKYEISYEEGGGNQKGCLFPKLRFDPEKYHTLEGSQATPVANNTLDSSSTAQAGFPTLMVVIIAVVVLVAILVAVGIFFYCRRRKNGRNSGSRTVEEGKKQPKKQPVDNAGVPSNSPMVKPEASDDVNAAPVVPSSDDDGSMVVIEAQNNGGVASSGDAVEAQQNPDTEPKKEETAKHVSSKAKVSKKKGGPSQKQNKEAETAKKQKSQKMVAKKDASKEKGQSEKPAISPMPKPSKK